MHELSIAQAIVQRTLASVELAPDEEVSRVFVDIGAHSGVHEDSLRFCIDLVKADTALSGASIEFRAVAMEFVCRACGLRQMPKGFSLVCHACGASDVDVVAGMEARVTGAEVRTRAAESQKDEG